MIEVVECRRSHLRAVAAGLREEERAECEAVGGKPRHLMNALYRRSSYRRAAILDGLPVAVWGDCAPSLSTQGWMWLFTRHEIERIPVTFWRQAKRELGLVLRTREIVRTSVLACSGRSIRFWTSLGATCELKDNAAMLDIRITRPA